VLLTLPVFKTEKQVQHLRHRSVSQDM